MACACKAVKEAKRREFKSAKKKIFTKRGFLFYIQYLFEEYFLNRFINTILTIALILIIFPFIAIWLIASYIITGDLTVRFPKRVLKYFSNNEGYPQEAEDILYEE